MYWRSSHLCDEFRNRLIDNSMRACLMPNNKETSLPERPKLIFFNVTPSRGYGADSILISDPLNVIPQPIEIPRSILPILELCDGTRTTYEIKGALLFQGIRLEEERIVEALQQMDSALLFENGQYMKAKSEKLLSYRQLRRRPMAHAGAVYPTNVSQLSDFIKENLKLLPRDCHPIRDPATLKGILSPHIDFNRGKSTYAHLWAHASPYMADIEQLIILGTDHNGGLGSITPTRQNYSTPFGTLRTDVAAVGEILENLEQEAVDNEELHHLSEHSIELALVWAHYFIKKKSISVIPILCGSFQHFINDRKYPHIDEKIANCVAALKQISDRKKTLIVAAGDLAHVGPQFGDSTKYDGDEKMKLEAKDYETLTAIEDGDAERFYGLSMEDQDSRKICGLSSIYLMLRVIGNAEGETIQYDQCPADETNTSLVSIAGSLLFTN